MIHVSCGSYHSTALEIFLNFFQCLSTADQSNYILHLNLDLLHTYSLKSGCSYKNLQLKPLNSTVSEENVCSSSISSVLNSTKKNDYILTLPAAKSDLVFNNKSFLGHTEYLRSFWNNSLLPMTFISPKMILLLLTDHIPLNLVSASIDQDIISNKILTFFQFYPEVEKINRIIFWGVNPHAGENFQLGLEEKELIAATKIIKSKLPRLEIIGPIASDAQFNYTYNDHHKDLLISPYHDQGLVFLKSVFGFLSSNVTFGGPNIRLSPDHGTAVDLIYKKSALYTSLLWTHQLIKSWSK